MRALLTGGSEVRRQLEAFIEASEDIDVGFCPLLVEWAARFKFIMVSERWIEAQHSITNKLLSNARHGGVANLAFAAVFGVLTELLKDPKIMEDMMQHSASVRNPRLAFEAMGLQWHPGVLELLSRKPKNCSKCRPDVIKILYHCDNLSMFSDGPAGAIGDDAAPPAPPPGVPASNAGEASAEPESAPSAPAVRTAAPLFAPEQTSQGGKLHFSSGSFSC